MAEALLIKMKTAELLLEVYYLSSPWEFKIIAAKFSDNIKLNNFIIFQKKI